MGGIKKKIGTVLVVAAAALIFTGSAYGGDFSINNGNSERIENFMGSMLGGFIGYMIDKNQDEDRNHYYTENHYYNNSGSEKAKQKNVEWDRERDFDSNRDRDRNKEKPQLNKHDEFRVHDNRPR